MSEKVRYSDEELEEFKGIINEKLATARHDYNQMMRQLMNADALVRIQNKTYGIDRMTGELIPKERLRIVPHATLSVQSKEARKH